MEIRVWLGWKEELTLRKFKKKYKLTWKELIIRGGQEIEFIKENYKEELK